MKLPEGAEVCDRCKTRVAKHRCMGCEDWICPECSFIFAIEFNATNHEKKKPLYNPITPQGTILGPGLQSLYPYQNPFNNRRHLTKSTWVVCKKCQNALENKDALEVIKESEEMKKLVEKIKKTVLSSRMLKGLEESEIKDEDEDAFQNIGNPFSPNPATSTYVPKKKGFFTSMFSGKKKRDQFWDGHDSYY